jgi:hypothetical protein
MKTFKHKVTGIVGTLKEDGHLHFERGNGCVVALEHIWGGFIENSSDWEEVIEKEWEILSFLNPGNQKIYNTDIITIDYNSRDLDYYLKYYYINSVKRLSDGIVFSVGDNTQMGLIVGIVIRNEQCWLQSDLNNTAYGCCLSIAEKVEELHKTQNSFTIGTGEQYFIVDNFRIRETVGGQFTSSKWDGFRFKERANAEDWILCNKPCLSLIDVTEKIGLEYSEVDSLVELVKTKLQWKI